MDKGTPHELTLPVYGRFADLRSVNEREKKLFPQTPSQEQITVGLLSRYLLSNYSPFEENSSVYSVTPIPVESMYRDEAALPQSQDIFSRLNEDEQQIALCLLDLMVSHNLKDSSDDPRWNFAVTRRHEIEAKSNIIQSLTSRGENALIRLVLSLAQPSGRPPYELK